MVWGVPEPSPAAPVLGDPASLSALALALRHGAAQIEQAVVDLDPSSVASRRHATRVRAVAREASALTGSMSRSANLLADHAGELADAVGLAARVVDRARSAGLVVDGPTIHPASGVRGVVDAEAESSRAETMRRLQQVLSAILLDLDTARRRLRDDLATERRAVRNR